jgi:hypothetical protein
MLLPVSTDGVGIPLWEAFQEWDKCEQGKGLAEVFFAGTFV